MNILGNLSQDEVGARLNEQPDMRELVFKIRRFDRESIIRTGRTILWRMYLENAQSVLSQDEKARRHIIIAVAPRIIALAMAFGTTRLRLAQESDFLQLCDVCFNLRDMLASEGLRKEVPELLRETQKSAKLSKYASEAVLRQMSLPLWVSRNLRSQHEDTNFNKFELADAYDLFQIWDDIAVGEPSRICESTFGITPLQFFRSSFCLYSLGMQDSGLINLGPMAADKELRETLNIDSKTMLKAASLISQDETEMQEWYSTVFSTIPDAYHKFVVPPFYRYPLIKRNIVNGNHYVIPTPWRVIRGTVNAFYGQILSRFSKKFGDAVEKNILTVMQLAFGSENVTKISKTNEKHADILIRHSVCDVIIEVKTSLGPYQEQSTLMPEGVIKIWERCYEISRQCASSFKKLVRPDHPMVAMSIVSEHFTGETLSYTAFADASGIFRDLEIPGIEFQSWFGILKGLSRNSSEDFMEQLRSKWHGGDKQKRQDLLYFTRSNKQPAYDLSRHKQTLQILLPLEVE